MTCLLAIDPGLTGALHHRAPDRIAAYDMPVVDGEINHHELARLIRSFSPDVALDRTRGTDAAGRRAAGVALRLRLHRGACGGEPAGNSDHIGDPGAWKKAMKVAGGREGKEQCQARALQLFPPCAASFARVKDQGRARPRYWRCTPRRPSHCRTAPFGFLEKFRRKSKVSKYRGRFWGNLGEHPPRVFFAIESEIPPPPSHSFIPKAQFPRRGADSQRAKGEAHTFLNLASERFSVRFCPLDYLEGQLSLQPSLMIRSKLKQTFHRSLCGMRTAVRGRKLNGCVTAQCGGSLRNVEG